MEIEALLRMHFADCHAFAQFQGDVTSTRLLWGMGDAPQVMAVTHALQDFLYVILTVATEKHSCKRHPALSQCKPGQVYYTAVQFTMLLRSPNAANCAKAQSAR